jgi:hypothetical protein
MVEFNAGHRDLRVSKHLNFLEHSNTLLDLAIVLLNAVL